MSRKEAENELYYIPQILEPYFLGTAPGFDIRDSIPCRFLLKRYNCLQNSRCQFHDNPMG